MTTLQDPALTDSATEPTDEMPVGERRPQPNPPVSPPADRRAGAVCFQRSASGVFRPPRGDHDAPKAKRPPPPPTFKGLDDTLHDALAQAFARWPHHVLETQPVRALLDTLMTEPTHARPFSGVVCVGDSHLILDQGLIIGAFDRATGGEGDEVVERLPKHASPTLYTPPETLPDTIMILCATLIDPRHTRHASLTRTQIDIPTLASQLVEDAFTGLIRLDKPEGGFAIFLVSHGQTVALMVSESWGPFSTRHPWPAWVTHDDVTATLDDPSVHISQHTYRHGLRDYVLDVTFVEPNAEVDPDDLFQAHASRWLANPDANESSKRQRIQRPQITVPAAHERAPLSPVMANAPMLRFVNWMLFDLVHHFVNREHDARWKYLIGWISQIARVRLHHPLPRPDAVERDVFDLVTEDAHGKVLHLCHRVPVGTPQHVHDFVQRVLAAKKARIKTGDVGGAILIAQRFEGDLLTAYREAIHTGEKSSAKWFFGLQRSVTGYAGFVRLGPRRGFHLLLVLETARGFQAILTDESRPEFSSVSG